MITLALILYLTAFPLQYSDLLFKLERKVLLTLYFIHWLKGFQNNHSRASRFNGSKRVFRSDSMLSIRPRNLIGAFNDRTVLGRVCATSLLIAAC